VTQQADFIFVVALVIIKFRQTGSQAVDTTICKFAEDFKIDKNNILMTYLKPEMFEDTVEKLDLLTAKKLKPIIYKSILDKLSRIQTNDAENIRKSLLEDLIIVLNKIISLNTRKSLLKMKKESQAKKILLQ
jgi:hypothetical protein